MAILTKKNLDRAMSWPVMLVACTWLAWLSQSDIAATLQGRYAPAVGQLQVTSVTMGYRTRIDGTRGAPVTILKGEAIIYRESCNYDGLDWKLIGENGKTVPVKAEFEDETQVREKGLQKWEALVIGVRPENVLRTVGFAKHDCGPFPVRSPFFFPNREPTLPALLESLAAPKGTVYSEADL